LRRENSISFEKSYQNNIVDSVDRKFKEDWIEHAKEMGAGYRLIRGLTDEMKATRPVITQGMDLAVSEKETADDTCNLSLCKLPDNRFIILNIERGKFSPAETRNVAVEQWQNFNPIQIRVENVAYQEAMRRDLADMNLPVVGYRTGGEKFREDIGIDTLAVLMENKRLILPYDKSDPRTVFLIDKLCDEMREFPSGHTGDSLMALWFAYTAMRDYKTGSNYMEWMKRKEQDMKNEQKIGGYGLQDFLNMYRGGGGVPMG
jgi:hypothetical protein